MTISVSDGAVIRGRLLDHEKPMAGAEIGLFPRNPGAGGVDIEIIGDPYEEIRIGTQEDGSFVIPNVPAPVNWYVYGKMESIAAIGADSSRRVRHQVRPTGGEHWRYPNPARPSRARQGDA